MKCADPSTAGYCVQPLNSPKVCLREGQLNWTGGPHLTLRVYAASRFPITALVLGWVEDSVARFDSRSCGIIFQVRLCFDSLVAAEPRSS